MIGEPVAPAALASAMGPDLAAALDRLAAGVVEAVPLIGAAYPGYQPSAYRLRLADGRLLKARRLRNQARADRVVCMLASLRGIEGIPCLIGSAGQVVLTDWVAGRGLGDAPACDDTVSRGAALQARVHRVPLSEAAQSHRPHETIDTVRFERRLAELVERQALSIDEAQAHRRVALEHRPPAAAVGFVLGDLCPDNLVQDGAGRLWLVDEEMLHLHAAEYDLARIWYRWPMSPAQRERYLSVYGRSCPVDAFLGHFPYWAIAVLAAAALFRVRRHPRAAAAPLERLRGLVRALDGGMSPAVAVLHV